MKTKRRDYSQPQAKKIMLDKDISIQMSSKPPGDPFSSQDSGVKSPF